MPNERELAFANLQKQKLALESWLDHRGCPGMPRFPVGWIELWECWTDLGTMANGLSTRP